MGERFGVTLIAQVLKGSNQKRIRELGFDQLSTFGLLRSQTEKEIVDTINYLLTEDYLQLTDGKYPVVLLTEKSIPVLKGEVTVWMKKSKTPVKDVRMVEENEELFEVLRGLRKQFAQEENVPPFVIFSDATLKEMCRYFPINEPSMLQIKGVGQSKFAKYGQAFIEEIKEFVSSKNIKVSEVPTSPKTIEQEIKKTDEKPSHVISYEMFNDGLSIDEISSKRNLSLVTIQNHIIRSAEEGHEINWNEIFDNDTEKKIIDTIQELQSDKLKPIWDAFDGVFDYFVIKAVICKNQISKEIPQQ